MTPDRVTLASLAGGAALERFQEGLTRILENIADPNTPAEKKRSLQLTVVFNPSKDRQSADLEIGVVTKPVAAERYPTRIFIGRIRGEYVAVENDPKQAQLFAEPEAPPAVQFPRSV